MKLPAIQFYPGDWLRDHVAGCSLAAQGLWLRMMILMHDSERYGYLVMNGSPIPPESIARRCGCDSLAHYETLLTELDSARVPERTKDGLIHSRRMVRDEKKRRLCAAAGRRGGGNPTFKGQPKGVIKGVTKPIPEEEVEDEDSFCRREGIPKGMRSDGFPSAYRDWKAYRAEKGEPLTSYTSKQILLKCERLGPKKSAAMIHLAIEKSWKNLFEEKDLKSFSQTNGKSDVDPPNRKKSDFEKSIDQAREMLGVQRSEHQTHVLIDFLRTINPDALSVYFEADDLDEITSLIK